MKKLSNREKILVSVLLVGIVVYLLFSYAFTPIKEKKTKLDQEIESLTNQTKDVQGLENQLQRVKKQSQELQVQIEKMNAQKGFGVMDYQELLTYLGESATKYNVDVVQFKRMQFENKTNYWEVPFEVKIQGDYRDIILFVDSLYQLDEYFAIRQLNLTQINLAPMSIPTGGAGEGGAGVSVFPWANDFISRLNEKLPSHLTNTQNPQNQQNTQNQTNGQNQPPVQTETDYLKYLEQLQGQYGVEEKVELLFSFHFISLEETPKDLK